MVLRFPTILEVPQDELGGASGARRFYVLTVGKHNSPEFPYSVANEKIASELGRNIGLRIPEVVLQRIKEEWHAFSYYISQTDTGEAVPEGTATEIAAFYAENASELHGMVCFDLFICNNDRKPDNFVIGEDRKVWPIDHGNCLYYRPRGTDLVGIPRLEAIGRDLKLLFDKPHGFVNALTSWSFVEQWCKRISQIPDHFIDSVIDNMPIQLLSDEERVFLTTFLKTRKNRLKSIIADHRVLFPNLSE